MTSRVFLLIFFSLSHAWGADPLPYSTRTRGYSGYSSTVRGDIRTVGMAGANTAIADSLIGSFVNPAGLAMTLPTSRVKATGNVVFDGNVQNRDEAMTSSLLMAGGHLYPWGFSLGYFTRNSEGQDYIIPSSNQEVGLEVTTTEFQFSAARLFLQNRLSIGAGFVAGRAKREMVPVADPASEQTNTAYALGGRLGVLYQFPHRWLLGATFRTPMTYGAANGGTYLTDFFQPVKSPAQASLGVGWIPNRYFRTGFSLAMVAPISDVALLSDDSVLVGNEFTVQPRIGVHYFLMEYKNFEVEATAGAYFEPPRMEGRAARFHMTTGIEVSPWIFDLGVGIDTSARYRNFIFSVGIHAIRTLRALGVVPPEKRRFARAGAFPNITRRSEVGLPRPLVRDPRNQDEGTNLRELRDNIQNEFNKAVDKIESTIEGDAEENSFHQKIDKKTNPKKKKSRKKAKKTTR